MGFSGGWAGSLGKQPGWFIRENLEQFPLVDGGATAGFVLGFHLGAEFWRAKPDWGLSIPITVVAGIRKAPINAMLGAGWHMFMIDHVDGKSGAGGYAPLAGARLGIDVWGYQLGVEARISRRWLVMAESHTQWQLGFFVTRSDP